jgi:hypothetical protein
MIWFTSSYLCRFVFNYRLIHNGFFNKDRLSVQLRKR